MRGLSVLCMEVSVTIEQAIAQYGFAAGLLIWVVAQVVFVFVMRWAAGVKAETKARDVITQERQTINGLLLKRDEDARAQVEKTDLLEGKIALLTESMVSERDASDEKIRLLEERLEEANRHRSELENRLTETENIYRQQLDEANALIVDLQDQVTRLRAQVNGSEDAKRNLTDRLFEEMKLVAKLTGEVEYMRGERGFAERVLSKVQPGAVVPEVAFNPSPV